MKNLNEVLLNAVDAATSVDSDFIEICNLQNCSLQAVIEGATTPNGTVKYQVSNDKPLSDLAPFTPTNWFDLTNASVSFTGSNGVKGTANIAISHHWLKAVYTYASGSGGTLTVSFHGNGQS